MGVYEPSELPGRSATPVLAESWASEVVLKGLKLESPGRVLVGVDVAILPICEARSESPDGPGW